jgi:uncharacterized protein
MRGVCQLKRIVRDTSWLMEALSAARDVGAPDWLIGAGAVRSAVWDWLHSFNKPSPLADIDVAFFDSADLSPDRDRMVERALVERLPGVPWEATNQAAVHEWFPEVFGYDVEPLNSTADGVATWPETATSVGMRLEDDDELAIVAPLGLDDLLGLVHRRNPARVSVEEYERRLVTKRIAERWPQAKIVAASRVDSPHCERNPTE